ncbi:MAG: NTP transferase domain-containing protein [Thermocladium sp.]
MIAVVMAGGRGSRLGGVEKAMLDVCGSPLIERVIKSLSNHKIVIAVSDNVPNTIRWCMENELDAVMTSGDSYSLDLGIMIRSIRKPFLVVPVDLPFIDGAVLEFEERALRLDASIITLLVRRGGREEPIGVSLIKGDGADWTNIVMNESSELMDIDYPSDLERAIAECESDWRKEK